MASHPILCRSWFGASDDRDYAAGAEALPRQALDQRRHLLMRKFTSPGLGLVELALVQTPGAEPDARSVVDQHLHAVAAPGGGAAPLQGPPHGAGVDAEFGGDVLEVCPCWALCRIMRKSSCLSIGSLLIASLHNQKVPGLSGGTPYFGTQGTFSFGTDKRPLHGHRSPRVRDRESDVLSLLMLGGRRAMGLPLVPGQTVVCRPPDFRQRESRIHLCTRLALRPCSRATPATEAPGCWHASTILALNAAVKRRLPGGCQHA